MAEVEKQKATLKKDNATAVHRSTPLVVPETADLSTLHSTVTNPNLARSDGILAAQKVLGNRKVTNLVQSAREVSHHDSQSRSITGLLARKIETGSPRTTIHIEHHRQPFAATIRRRSKTQSTDADHRFPAVEHPLTSSRLPARYRDAAPGNEAAPTVDFATLMAQTTAISAGAVAEPETGESVTLPDIVLAPDILESDAIASTLTYAPTVSQSGPPPPPFGETSPYNFSMSGIKVTSASATFTVKATVDNPVVFQVTSGTRTDISSEADPDITQTNYPTVAKDLTPNMSDLGGRPPRTKFWAEDLCILHERFHADEGIGHARSGVTLAQNWLNGQSAASVAEVTTLVNQVPARVAATRAAAMTYPGRENRAYGDGAPLYKARADEIKRKGAANEYAPPSGATGTAATPAPATGTAASSTPGP